MEPRLGVSRGRHLLPAMIEVHHVINSVCMHGVGSRQIPKTEGLLPYMLSFFEV